MTIPLSTVHPTTRFDVAIEILLFVLLAFAPLAFGVVHAWSEFLVILLAVAMSACLAVKLLVHREVRFVWTWAYVPIVLFIFVAAFQLVPLPARVLATISPETLAVKTSLLGDQNHATLSFYPYATRHDVRLLLVFATVFVVVLNVYRRPDQIKRLLVVIVAIGSAVGLLALAQVIEGGRHTYWFGENVKSGTFVNHNTFSQFMNLSIGAALGLMLLILHQRFSGHQFSFSELRQYLRESNASVVWCLAAMVSIGAATVFLSLSRGGSISLLLAGGFTGLVLATKGGFRGRGWMLIVLALVAFIFVLYSGLDAVYERMATLREFENNYESRYQILQDITAMFRKFAIFGVGLGNHEVVYPMFDQATAPRLASHVENEYFQLAEEMGSVGLILLLTFACIIGYHFVRIVRRTNNSMDSIVFGLGFGLVAVTINSFSDFSQHFPAAACLTAIMCGLVVQLGTNPLPSLTEEPGEGVAVRSHKPAPPADVRAASWATPIFPLRTPLSALCSLCIAVVWIWALIGANDARAAETHWRQALKIEQRLSEDVGENEDYADIIAFTANAARIDPDNIQYQYWQNVYRWRSISRVSDADTDQLILPDEGLEYTQRIADELKAARRLCPTFGPLYCVLGQLERFVLDRPDGARNIRTGYKLARYDATACYVAGLLDAHEGLIDASVAKFARALTLSGGLFSDMAQVYVHEVDRPDLAFELAGEDLQYLSYLASMLDEKTEHTELAEQVRAKVFIVLKARSDDPDVPTWILAEMARRYQEQQDHELAILYYGRALDRDYAQVDLRMAYAKLLVATGQNNQAIRQAKICLRLRPQMSEAKNLIANLSVAPRSSVGQ